MANRLEVTRAIREHVTSTYTGDLPLLLDANDDEPKPVTGYIALRLNWGRHEGVTSGSPALWESTCSVALEVAVPADTGEGTLLAEVDTLSSVFSGVILAQGAVEFTAEHPIPAGNGVPDGLRATGVLWLFTWREWRHHNPAFEAIPVNDAVVQRVITASAHGLTRGQLVYQNAASSSGFSLAIATAESTLARAIVGEVHAPTALDIVPLGLVYLPGHGLGAKGAALFLSDATAGLLTATAPTTANHWRQKVGEVWGPHHVLILGLANAERL